MAEKTWVVEQVTEFQSQLFLRSLEDSEFRSIGTLFPSDDSEPAKSSPQPGRIVSRLFFWGDHFHYDVARGPYQSSYGWLSAYLSIIHQAQTETLEKEKDEDTREEAEDCLRVAMRLANLLPKIFPPFQNPAERTILWHDDLSLQNILVDDDAKVTALVDWECVSTKPLWVATEMPKFLNGKTREEEPNRDDYGGADEGEEDSADDDELDDEGKTDLYWMHLMEYEQTQLRKLYTAKMKKLWPRWESEAKDASLKSDFLGAVGRCASGWYLKRIEQWVDRLEEGGAFPRLMDILSPNIN